MTGETNLPHLLKSMQPVLDPKHWVFVSLPWEQASSSLEDAAGWVREEEGVTLILAQQAADRAGLSYQNLFQRITLQVHSSLVAVGLLAEITRALAEADIASNVISGYYHDHLYVPAGKGAEALGILQELSSRF